MFFTISEFSDGFVKSMNQEDIVFKNRFILENYYQLTKDLPIT